jgi:tRNA (guanine37-N1)-methyltransferase
MLIDVVTIFPAMFAPVLGESIIKRAITKGLVRINVHDLREYSDDSHKKIDAPSYGGGGMVFTPQPLFSAVEKLKGMGARVVLMGPQGKRLNQKMVRSFLNSDQLIILAPRYEGVDERVRENIIDDEVSIGDYVLSGGELPAMVFIDSIVRLIPGVVSDSESVANESFENDLLDYPHYTWPQEFRGLKVPEVLAGGNHKKIVEWRKNRALELTKKLRPDLLKGE